MKAILLMVLALALVGSVYAAPAVVTGQIFLSDGVTPVEGATVTVNCEHDSVMTPQITLSLVDGSYSAVYFDNNECYFGDNVFVEAEKDGVGSGSATGTVCSEELCPIGVALVNVTIPEFTLLGAMVVVLAGIGIVAYKRKN